MPTPANDTVLKVADLLDRPGASRRVGLTMAPPADLDIPLVEAVEPVRLDGVVESVVEGLLVRGTLSATLHMDCARCLEGIDVDVTTDVAELFTDPEDVDAGDEVDAGYEIREGTIDLDTLLRDALVPAVPFQPLCEAACKGLCPTCGIDRNEGDCSCDQTVADRRWAALEGLDLRADGS
jgi:uncharacterized protein